MTTIICNNNQYLKSLTTIPINGIPDLTLQTKITIDDGLPEAKKVPIKVQNYLLSAEWCHGIKPTDCPGWYLLITTYQQIAKVQVWLDETSNNCSSNINLTLANLPLSKDTLSLNVGIYHNLATNLECMLMNLGNSTLSTPKMINL